MKPKKKLDDFNRKWIIRLFGPGEKTIAQIAYITGYSHTTVGKVITQNIEQNRKKTHESN